jgi:hypothetical protein
VQTPLYSSVKPKVVTYCRLVARCSAYSPICVYYPIPLTFSDEPARRIYPKLLYGREHKPFLGIIGRL